MLARDGLREGPLRGRGTASRRSRSTTPRPATRSPTSCSRAARRAAGGPRRRGGRASSSSPPRTRRSSPPGANLGAFGGRGAHRSHKHFGTELFVEVFRLIGELGKPSIVAANGHVLAGSLGIALACDLIVATEGAGFGTPEINVGLFPFMIMALIYRNVPRKKTNEMLLLGRAADGGGGARGRDRQQGRAGRGVRRRGRRLGGEAGREVAAGDAARQGRDLAADGHAPGRGARLPALPADDRALDRGRDRGRRRRSSRSASRNGRDDDGDRGPTRTARTQRRRRRALLPRLPRRRPRPSTASRRA